MVRHHVCAIFAIATETLKIATIAIFSGVKQMVCSNGRIGFWIWTLDMVSHRAFH
jgi:hypothetical protein